MNSFVTKYLIDSIGKIIRKKLNKQMFSLKIILFFSPPSPALGCGDN